MIESRKSDWPNRLAMQKIGVCIVLPYCGYWFATMFTDGLLDDIPWKLALGAVPGAIGIGLTIWNIFLAFAFDSRSFIFPMLASCLAGTIYGAVIYSTGNTHLISQPTEIFGETLIFYFLANGIILMSALLGRKFRMNFEAQSEEISLTPDQEATLRKISLESAIKDFEKLGVISSDDESFAHIPRAATAAFHLGRFGEAKDLAEKAIGTIVCGQLELWKCNPSWAHSFGFASTYAGRCNARG